MLFHKSAKCFDELPKAVVKAYHKCHISKTMGIAVVAMAFDDSLENGGTAFNICFERAQSCKIAQRLSRNKKGEVLRKKGDSYFVDCSVTGSSYGIAKDPKFPLKPFLKKTFPLQLRILLRLVESMQGIYLYSKGTMQAPIQINHIISLLISSVQFVDGCGNHKVHKYHT